MIVGDYHIWWSEVIYDEHIWGLYIIIIYDEHIWWSYIYNEHIWWSCMIIMYDDHIWQSCNAAEHISTSRNFQIQFCCYASTDNTSSEFLLLHLTLAIPDHFLGKPSCATFCYTFATLRHAILHSYAFAFIVELVPMMLNMAEDELNISFVGQLEICCFSFRFLYFSAFFHKYGLSNAS